MKLLYLWFMNGWEIFYFNNRVWILFFGKMNIDKAKKRMEIYFCPMVKRKKKTVKLYIRIQKIILIYRKY